MTPTELLEGPMAEARRLLPSLPWGDNICIQLIATCLQESGLTERRQRNNGPARGLAQFEKGGGVHGVMTHKASKGLAKILTASRNVSWDEKAVWSALEFDDVLAIGVARLLYWTDAKALPLRGDIEGAWELYLRVWRPGKPHRERWTGNYNTAVTTVIGAQL